MTFSGAFRVSKLHKQAIVGKFMKLYFQWNHNCINHRFRSKVMALLHKHFDVFFCHVTSWYIGFETFLSSKFREKIFHWKNCDMKVLFMLQLKRTCPILRSYEHANESSTHVSSSCCPQLYIYIYISIQSPISFHNISFFTSFPTMLVHMILRSFDQSQT